MVFLGGYPAKYNEYVSVTALSSIYILTHLGNSSWYGNSIILVPHRGSSYL